MESHRPTVRTWTYRGWLAASAPDELGCRHLELIPAAPSETRESLAERVNADMNQGYTPGQPQLWDSPWSVRYWLSRTEQSPEALVDATARQCVGQARAYDQEGYTAYSEWTPGAASKEVFTVGGHDLLEELWAHCGWFLHLEVVVQ